MSEASPGRGPVLTVGHSTHTLPAFLALLGSAGVELLADVRRFPGSRRLPHFGRESLRDALIDVGVGYDHLGELGGRRRPAADSPNGGWENASFRGYADHLGSEEFARGLRRLEERAVHRRVAVMCAEAPWWRCHRRLLSDVLLVRGWEVVHLGPDGRRTPHTLTPWARLGPEGRLTYPPPQTKLPV